MWRRPILPAGCPTSTFGAVELNFRVRYEYGWILNAIITTMAIYTATFLRGLYTSFSALFSIED